MTIRQKIAAAAGITASRVTQIAAAGCPVDNVENALTWIRENVRRHDNRPVELPPEAARLRVGPKARLERATDAERAMHALWRAAVESGTATPWWIWLPTILLAVPGVRYVGESDDGLGLGPPNGIGPPPIIP